MFHRLFALPALIVALAAAPAQAQYTERWSEAPVRPAPQAAPELPQGGGPVRTERWSEPAGEADQLHEIARGVGETAGYMEHCGLDTTALQAAFDDLLTRANATAGERARRLAARDAARAAARAQAAASGKIRQGACPPDVVDKVRAAHGQVIDSLGRIAAEVGAAQTRPVTVTFQGQVHNTDVGVSSTAALSLTVAGRQLTGFLRTEPPLHATGPLTGRVDGAECILRGRMQEGFDIDISGTCGPDRFDGGYTVMVNGQPQNGAFALVRSAAGAAGPGMAAVAPAAPRPMPAPSSGPVPGAGTVDLSAVPLVDGGKIPGRVEVRSGCDKLFASRSGPNVPIRWFGITETVTLIGRRSDGELCALYADGSSEWIAADRVMSAAEKRAHDQDMQALGAGLQRRQGGAGGTAQDVMDKLRETGNALHRETQEQYRQTEKHYEDRRRYGQ